MDTFLQGVRHPSEQGAAGTGLPAERSRVLY